MDKHITLVGVLHIVWHSLAVGFGFLAFTILTLAGRLSCEPEAIRILGIVGWVILVFVTLLAIPGVIGGIAVLKRKSWGRILTMVVSIFDLLDIPVGTALGAYSLWVLLHDDTIAIFEGRSGS